MRELQRRLAKDAVVVIFGAPGSGKTEQMELALQGKPYTVFDLRNMFLTAHFQKNDITDPAAQADIKKKYEGLKKDEREWISSNKDKFINELAASKDDIIVFDEFDMAKSFESGSAASESAKIVLEIAQAVRQKNASKKVIFIIHEEGLHSEEVARAMKDNFSIAPLEKMVIRTGYISPPEEKMLLAFSNMSVQEKIKFMNLMQGHPSAYLALINQMSGKAAKEALTYDALVANAKATIKKVYAVMEKIQPKLIPIFKELSQGYSKQALENKLALIDSGFVDAKLFMSEIVKQVILELQKSSRLFDLIDSANQLGKNFVYATTMIAQTFAPNPTSKRSGIILA